LITHNYVVTETIALIHRRLGTDVVRAFVDRLLPVCEVRFIDSNLHARALSAFLAVTSRRPSFVDRVSFEVMRESHIDQAFAIDRDFRDEGFVTVP
jgi:predicted nucleic acid-binding protein